LRHYFYEVIRNVIYGSGMDDLKDELVLKLSHYSYIKYT